MVIILISCCLSLLIVSMDATIVNVAIPSIRIELHASGSELQWVIDVYTLVLALLLLLSGATADRFGRRRGLSDRVDDFRHRIAVMQPGA